MKHLIYIIGLILLQVSSLDLNDLRTNYALANDNKEITQKVYNALSAISKDDKTIFIAYKGAISTLLAKHSKVIKDKKKHFKEGIELLEFAVEQDPKNIEIRCLRLGVQENSPKFLKYKFAIQSDKQFILDHYSTTLSKDIKSFVKNYVLQSNTFNQDEKQLF